MGPSAKIPWGLGSTAGSQGLIVRIVRGTVAADLVPAFHDLAASTVPELRLREGVVSANVARQIAPDGGEDVVFATVWRGMPDLYAWIGCSNLLDTPAPISTFEEYLAGCDLQYYEVIDTDAVAVDAVRHGPQV